MPSDDYAAVGGGALRIKGAKIKKHKKKKTGKSDLEKNLSTGEPLSTSSSSKLKDREEIGKEGKKEKDGEEQEQKQEQEREEEEEPTERRKTEAERRFEEARKKKLLELSESANSRPGLLKTHKERVEELNTYLSKLSEHHDMPKIGPG